MALMEIYSVHKLLQALAAYSVAFVHSTKAHTLELGEARLPQLQEIRGTGRNVSNKRVLHESWHILFKDAHKTLF